MSDCGVCIGQSFDGEDNQFEVGTCIAEKPSECCECGRLISVGEKHEVASYNDDDNNRVAHDTCSICSEVAWSFSCEGRMYLSLWDDMEDVFEGISQACFDKLKTPDAKAELQRRWMKWKGLPA